VRYDNERGFAIFPPSLSKGGEWIEMASGGLTKNHSPEQLLRALGNPNTPL
jgi:hypothetical protein